ncbi:MAG: hypothetical protein OSA99_14935 [Acidimicrobiales bacterium]|nr:hypothetical protein [Acidimicrobiales bacterium]
MLVIDEYLAVRGLAGAWPSELSDTETLVLPSSRHFRLLQRLHQPGGGQLSQLLEQLSDGGADTIVNPHPEVLSILDPRPLLNIAAGISAAHGIGGLLNCETLAAGLTHGRELWFGTARNVGRLLTEVADDLDISIHVAEPDA